MNCFREEEEDQRPVINQARCRQRQPQSQVTTIQPVQNPGVIVQPAPSPVNTASTLQPIQQVITPHPGQPMVHGLPYNPQPFMLIQPGI